MEPLLKRRIMTVARHNAEGIRMILRNVALLMRNSKKLTDNDVDYIESEFRNVATILTRVLDYIVAKENEEN